MRNTLVVMHAFPKDGVVLKIKDVLDNVTNRVIQVCLGQLGAAAILTISSRLNVHQVQLVYLLGLQEHTCA
jgi:hypothetical protein